MDIEIAESFVAEPRDSNSPQSVGAKETWRSLRWWTFLLLAWLLGTAYAGAYLNRGWVPHDDGAFAQSADRVLHGELPHRDYAEYYTGGLAYLHAAAFKYLGENLATMRIPLFAVFVAWIPVFYWIACRFVREWVAAGVTILAVTWSLPNYSAAVPSWYCLFFATFGLAALLAHIDDHSPKWLLIAGICGGLSFLAKISGLFYIAGVFLYFLISETENDRRRTGPGTKRIYAPFVAVSALALAVALVRLVRPLSSPQEYLDFVVPAAALGVAAALRTRQGDAENGWERLNGLLKLCAPFCAGVAIPIGIFLVPYVKAGALSMLVRGLFVLPARRVVTAFMLPPTIDSVLPCVILAIILLIGSEVKRQSRNRILLYIFSAAVAVLFAFYLLSSADSPWNYQVVWNAAYWLIPLTALAGSAILASRARSELLVGDRSKQEELFLILSISALCALVQFPFSGPIYFCYVAPLAILSAVALLRLFSTIPRPLLALVYALFLLFAVFRVTPPFIYIMGFGYQPDPQTERFGLPRTGNLRVAPRDIEIYSKLVPLVQAHAGTGEIYAGPDAPHIYFLTGYRNPTATLAEMFDANGEPDRILKLVDSRPINVVVINNRPAFAKEFPKSVQAALRDRFPNEVEIKEYDVLWRP